MSPVPFVIYSDGPRMPTGLARIARDLASRIWDRREVLGVNLLQIGYDPVPGAVPAWPVWALPRLDSESDWGAQAVSEAWQDWFGRSRPAGDGVLFSIWDPGRSYPLLSVPQPASRWGYFPVDAVNVNGSLGGPAREAIARYDRVLAYGRWASEVLSTIRRPVAYLPHGLDLDTWDYHRTVHELGRAEEILQPREGEWILGCVATNQPRKDLGLYFGTLAELRRRGQKVRGWLHTDVPTRAWAVAQLVEDFGLQRRVTLTTAADHLTDQELASCYACCGVTLAPGLGEGLGYPIIESLACGTPPVHGDYGGGTELVPLNVWHVPRVAERLESVYTLVRPVYQAVNFADAVERALDWKRGDERTCQAYCRGQVAYLDWRLLWPRWESWIKHGLEVL